MTVSQDWNVELESKISEHIQMYFDKIRKLMNLAELYNVSVDIDCLIADLVKAQSDSSRGWYLHLDPKSGGDNVLYLSKANVSKEQALLLAAAPELLEALKLLTNPLYLTLNQLEHHRFTEKARLAIAKATGEKL